MMTSDNDLDNNLMVTNRCIWRDWKSFINKGMHNGFPPLQKQKIIWVGRRKGKTLRKLVFRAMNSQFSNESLVRSWWLRKKRTNWSYAFCIYNSVCWLQIAKWQWQTFMLSKECIGHSWLMQYLESSYCLQSASIHFHSQLIWNSLIEEGLPLRHVLRVCNCVYLYTDG